MLAVAAVVVRLLLPLEVVEGVVEGEAAAAAAAAEEEEEEVVVVVN